MIKGKLLLDVVNDLHSLANSVQAVADAMAGSESAETTSQEIQVPAKEPEPPAKVVTLEQVRAVLAEKSQEGFTFQVRELLQKYGALKLSQIAPASYAALLSDAEGLK